MVLPSFDFGPALPLTLDERIRAAVARGRLVIEANGLAKGSSFPPIPETGGSEEEIAELERSLGVTLPPEYRRFLEHHRYFVLDDFCQIGGLPHDGRRVAEGPWMSDRHPVRGRALVIGFYGFYADGDQLLFPLDDPDHPVVVYLHEYPVVEAYAPTFSLALWRLAFEQELDVLDD